MTIRTLVQIHRSIQGQSEQWQREVLQIAQRCIHLLIEYSDLRHRVDDPVRLWNLAEEGPVVGNSLNHALSFFPEMRVRLGVEMVLSKEQEPNPLLVVPLIFGWDGETRSADDSVKASHVIIDGGKIPLSEEPVVKAVFDAVEWRLQTVLGVAQPLPDGIDVQFREEPYLNGPKTIVTIRRGRDDVRHQFACVPGVLGEIDRQLVRAVFHREGKGLYDQDQTAVINRLIEAGVRL
jgi:hypothetical protein